MATNPTTASQISARSDQAGSSIECTTMSASCSAARRRHRICGQRAEDAAPPQLAEERGHFTWCATTLFLIFA